MMDSPAQKPTWMTEGFEKRARVKAMFGELASRYDLLNSLISLRLHGRWRAAAVKKLNLKPGNTVLDLCCGTGGFAMPLAKSVGNCGRILGLDFCLPMLEIAHEGRPSEARYSLGDALKLPLSACSVDGVAVGWGIRNLVDIDEAHREIFRVLKGGKFFASVDMARPQRPLIRAFSTLLFVSVVPLIASFFGKGRAYMYLPKSTEKFKSREELAESMRRAGFQEVGWEDLMFGNICIHWGQKP